MGYTESGEAVYSTTKDESKPSVGLVTESYAYSNLDCLVSVVRDGVQVDHREYDASGHVLQTGSNGNLP